ncbi:hypothetical protein [Aquibacillus saliphilus]|uniref:hypothetical protein n=1 Tax=Aquibacillus saliphilus TaxID=1909422 RepID=UPI001CF05CEA|nr:hypothetical protein [Aquibacillus saliphilus]
MKRVSDEIGIDELSGDREYLEMMETNERNLESAVSEILELIKDHNEELAHDCQLILDKWSESL